MRESKAQRAFGREDHPGEGGIDKKRLGDLLNWVSEWAVMPWLSQSRACHKGPRVLGS
jgi:hypothetical protein